MSQECCVSDDARLLDVSHTGHPVWVSQEVYSDPDYANSFDAVVTCFFLDTAHNVVEYLEIIHRCVLP